MDATHRKLVGPIIRGMDGEFVSAIISAIETDNPDQEVLVDDQGGYVRVATEQFCRLTRSSLEDELGYDFDLSQIEPCLAGFAGRILVSDNEVTWRLEREE